MMKSTPILALLLFFILLLPGCSEDADSAEAQIRGMLSSMETAIQERSLDNVKSLVSPDYKDEWHPDRRAALRSLLVYFQGHTSIHLLTRVSDLVISDDEKTATLVVFVGMAGKPIENADYLVALNADLFRFEVDLVNDGDDWLVAGTSWQRVRPESFAF
jgi:hypothetical protein